MPAPKVRSKDSAQQRLRDRKRQWNSVYKDFSQKLKAFKDGLNGRGNAKIGLPPSNIKDPMPAEVGSYLSQLAGEFQKIVGDAEGIITEQEQYARTRRKRQPKSQVPQATVPNVPEAPSQEQDKIVDTLSRLGTNNSIFAKDASSKLSRVWQYLSSIFSNKQFNKQRIGLLSQSADLYKSLEDFENDVLSLSINNIPNAVGKFKNFKYNFDAFHGTFDGVVDLVARKSGISAPKEDEEGTERNSQEPLAPEPPKPIQPIAIPNDIMQIRDDIHLLFNSNLAKKEILAIGQMIKEYEEEQDPNMKSIWEDRITENYKGIVNALSNSVQKRYGPVQIKNVKDLINHIKKNTPKEANSLGEEFIKSGHNSISRYLKKQLIKAVPYNKTAPVRLEISEVIEDMKITVANIMDSLEKDLSIEDIKSRLNELGEDIVKLKKPLHVLNVFYMKDFFAKKDRVRKDKKEQHPTDFREHEDPFVDYILKRKLKRDLSEDLS